MSYQPKSYRKFLAGAVTTALVASAVAPVAGAEAADFSFTDDAELGSHKDNIYKAVEAGFINGYPNEDGSKTFKPYQDITRGQVVKILANTLGDDVDTSGVENFKDLEGHGDPELIEAALKVRAADIFSGTEDGNLLPANKITRQQMAKVLVKAFDLESKPGEGVDVKDLDAAFDDFKEYIQVVAQNEVTNQENFNPLQNVTRAQFATFVVRAMGEEEAPVEELAIESVSAIDANTISVVFEGVEDAVEIELDEALVNGENEVTFTYNDQEFTVTVNYEAPVEELVVESVSAIDTTKVVTINATAPNAEEGATATVAIFAYDEEGVVGETAKVTVEDVEIVEGAIEVEVDAVAEALASGDYVAVVTVGEEEAELDFTLDFEAVDAAVAAVNAANSEIKLAAALSNEFFVDYDASLITAYDSALGTSYNTVAEIQEVINTVNAGESFDDLVAELQAAANQIERFNILDREFERVDADNINAYDLAFNAPTFDSGTSSLEEIQNTIDATNAAEAIAALTDGGELVEGVTQADIDAAQALIDILPEDYTTTTLDSDLSDVQDLLDAANALETATEAVEALFVDIEAAELELAPGVDQDVIDAAQEALDAYTGTEDTTALQTAIDDAQDLFDAAVLADATEAIEALTNEAGDALVEGVTQADIDAAQDLLDAYAGAEDTTALQTAIDDAQEMFDVAAINAAIEAEDVAALQAIIVEFDIDAYNNLTKAQRTELTAYVIANTTEEVTATADFSSAISTADTGYVDSYLADIAAVNEATSISVMRDALVDLGYDVYDELTSVEQLNVAEVVYNTVSAEDFVDYTTMAQIKADIDAAIAQ